MGSQGSLGGIHGYLGGTDGTLGPMGPWDRWDLGLKDPGPQGPPIIKLHIDYIMKLFIDTRPGLARPGPAIWFFTEVRQPTLDFPKCTSNFPKRASNVPKRASNVPRRASLFPS